MKTAFLFLAWMSALVGARGRLLAQASRCATAGRRGAGALVLLWAAGWSGGGAWAAEAPTLQIDSGGHMAMIRSVVFTPDGRYLVSASDDKTIRVWDWRAGKTVRVLRGQVGPGNEGKIFAMALSPDGRWLATAGYMHNGDGSQYGDIRLYDFERGEIVALLKGHPNGNVNAVAFSPDGARLVSGSSDDSAIVWDVSKHRLLHRLQGHSDDIYGVAFSRDGRRVVTASDDTTLRLWSTEEGKLIAKLEGHHDDVDSVAFSPTEDLIASGSFDHRILLWDGTTGKLKKELADQGTKVGSLSFSPDGRYLLSGVGSSPNHCHVYNLATGQETFTYKGHDNAVIATAISPDGRWAATGGGNNNEIHVWDIKTGKLEQRLAGGGASVWAVGFSQDGKRLLWGKTSGYQGDNERGPLQFQIDLPDASQNLGQPRPYSGNGAVRAKAELDGWSLVARVGGDYGYEAILDIRKNGKTQASIERGSSDGYRHRSYGFTPDGRAVISSASNGFLTAYSLDGKKIGNFVGHTGEVWALAVSPDGRWLASSSDDQTVRLWNLETRENLLTLFQAQDGEWVAWTPSGYYAASPGGSKLIGWHVNRGADQAADYYPAEQFRQSRDRPELVAETLRRGGEKAALAALGDKRPAVDVAEAIAAKPATPRLVAGPAARVASAEQTLELAVDARAEHLIVTVNGRPTRGLVRIDERRMKETLQLSPGDNLITAIARNKVGDSDPLELRVTLEATQPDYQKPALYLLAIGVSDYADPGLNLKYAHRDAIELSERLAKEKGGLYRDVLVKTLTNGEATRANILKALSFLEKSGPDDLVILFMAGHGKLAGYGTKKLTGDFYFLPHDADYQEPRSTGVKGSEFAEILGNLPGKVILLTDACHSAAVASGQLRRDAADQTELAKEFADAAVGALVFTSSQGQEYSMESADWQHGAFTKALLDGLSGAADYTHDGVVHLSELNLYVRRRVPDLTDGHQHPITITPQQAFADFALAKVK